MLRRTFLTASIAVSRAFTQSVARPNVVVILADDFGYGSPNCYGSDPRHVRTPNIDRLAREGVRFTDANTPSSVCTPTRYGLLTGRYCWRTSLKYNVLGINSPLHIETSRLSMASLLKKKGYHTAAIGKWHLGYQLEKTDYTRPLQPGPLQLGFDYHFGVPQNHGDATGIFVENDSVLGLRSSKVEPFGRTPYGRQYIGIDAPHRDDDTVMDVLTARAVDWIGKQKGNQPFFLFFTPVAVHEPTTPSQRTRGSSGVGPAGDWIHDLDASVGRILAALDKGGLTKNTLVVFTSDNGAVALADGDRAEAVAYRAGFRANGNWRGRKHSIHEGGFRVPFLVRWPGRAPAGTTCSQTISLVDMLATTAAITGSPLTSADEGAEDSFNVLPAFLGQQKAGPLRDAIITHSVDGNFAIRQGDWKYIEGKAAIPVEQVLPARREELVPQLYNLTQDPAETKNLIKAHPEIAGRLKDLLSTARASGRTRPGRASP